MDDNTTTDTKRVSINDFYKNAQIGFVVGLAQGIIGHPLDTIKTLIQNGIAINKSHLKFKTLYAGFRQPLMMGVITNATVFGIRDPNDTNHIKHGLYAGLINSPVVYLYDKAKIKAQTKDFMKEIKIEKSFFVSIIKGEKSYNYVYKYNPLPNGFVMTVMRECIGFAGYLQSYFYFRDQRQWHPFFAGGMAGATSWTLTYCIDVVKTRQMTQNISMLDAIRQGGLWKGYGYCLTRAVIVNSITLTIYAYLEEKFL